MRSVSRFFQRLLQDLHLAFDGQFVDAVGCAQRRAPDLFALARVQVAEEILEAGDKVDLVIIR